MKILISGATGFIGKALCKRLLIDGHELVILVRGGGDGQSKFPYPCETFTWGSDGSVPDKALDGVGAVVNLAGESIAGGRWTAERKERIISSRVKTTRALAEALRRLKNRGGTPPILVSTSAVGYYGDRGDESLTEKAASGLGFLSEVCQRWEGEATAAAASRIVLLRLGVVLGREGGALPLMMTPFTLGMGGRLGSGKQWMPWVHKDDVVECFYRAATGGLETGVYNVVAPDEVTNGQFTKALAAAMHRPAVAHVPAFAMKAALGEMSAMVLHSQRVVPAALGAAGFRFRHGTLAGALEDLCLPSGEVLFTSEQFVAAEKSIVFPFFSDPKNLEAITPPWLGFKVLSSTTPQVQEGTLIDYRLSLHGLPLRWRTRIEEWRPGERFVDTQLKGPYTKWHHTHLFHDVPAAGARPAGVLMEDRVRYRLPLGALGLAAAGWYVRRDVGQIFGYRRKVIEEKFGGGGKH